MVEICRVKLTPNNSAYGMSSHNNNFMCFVLQQLEDCFSDVSTKDEEIAQIKEQLNATKNRLEEVEEEYQMLKLSLTRREEELTATLDKNL